MMCSTWNTAAHALGLAHARTFPRAHARAYIPCAAPHPHPHRVRTSVSRIIAIANQKGGVGKTTTAINLGACLAVAERRTLVVDIDPQANATSGLGVAKERVERSIYDVLVEGASAESAILREIHFPFLDLLPATRDLVGVEVELVGRAG